MKFPKAGNNRDKNFTRAEVVRRRAQLEECAARLKYRYSNAEAGKELRRYWTTACPKRQLNVRIGIEPLRHGFQRLLVLRVRMRAMRQRRETIEHRSEPSRLEWARPTS